MSSTIKVTVLGAAGGIGQPLSLLLKLNPYITELSLYDVVNIPGIAADLNHIDTNVKINSFIRDNNEPKGTNTQLINALKGSDFIIIPAGIPRKPGMTRGDLFNINASICNELATFIAIHSPNSFILVISNPVNSTIPIFREILNNYGVFNPLKLFGVTALDNVRSNTFISNLIDNSLPKDFNVPVVGGHSGHSIVPLFSQLDKSYKILDDNNIYDALIHRVQYGGDEIVEAKNGNGSSTLSMAYASNKFFNIIINGYLNLDNNNNNNNNCQISSYIYLDDSINGMKELKTGLMEILKGTKLEIPKYLAIPMNFDINGIKNVDYKWIDKMNEKEKELFVIAVGFINQNVEKGLNFVYK
ncbi:malate dehydrogenase [Pichia kluyveri]|uniref:malate dehydrogenase n=1 Tax=Pichia kluyveri TaxID=36015 RepID=A0AAV5QXE5_PICKL|nr:malate dehydrogenase [Pichia kluyveri]